MPDENYREQIARLQREAIESELVAAQNEALHLESEIKDLWQSAAQADDSGDHDTAIYYSRAANEKTQELQAALSKLPQAPAYSEKKIEWMQRRPDLVSHPEFFKTAGAWHEYLMRLGVQDDSEQYRDMMTAALEPAGYEAQPSPDDVINEINKTSKYCDVTRGGKPLTAKQYNAHVPAAQAHTLAQLKAAGKI